MHQERFFTLSASCPDRVGIVARVSGFFAEHKGWILETANHSEPSLDFDHNSSGRYFMRIEVKANSLPFMLTELRERFAPIGLELAPGTPEQLAARVKTESAKWTRAMAEAGIEAE